MHALIFSMTIPGTLDNAVKVMEQFFVPSSGEAYEGPYFVVEVR